MFADTRRPMRLADIGYRNRLRLSRLFQNIEGVVMPVFIPGLELSRLYYEEAVKPILDSHFPVLDYAAARIGPGSDILGYDSERSTDHSWGPRLQLFLTESDHNLHACQISEALSQHLPVEFRGYPTNFVDIEGENGRLMTPITTGPIKHWVDILTTQSFFTEMLGLDPNGPIEAIDWLTFSEQSLLSITRGAVYIYEPGELTAMRKRFEYYANDVWLYVLAAQWTRISQEEPFMARCAEAGDEIGSRIIAARLVHDIMRLCFLIEKRYAPYSKWLGTAFRKLALAEILHPVLEAVLDASDWRDRQRKLSTAHERVAAAHNELGITEPLPTEVSQFHGRPYDVIDAARFAEVIRAQIRDPEVLALAPDIGSIDQCSHSTDILSRPDRRRSLRAV